MLFSFVLRKGDSFSVSSEMVRLMRFRYVPVVSHKLIQLTGNATGNTTFLFLNAGIVQIKTTPAKTRNLSKAQRSALDLHFILLLCSVPSLIITLIISAPSLTAI